MYVSSKQLANYLSLPNITLSRLAQQLTSLGLETEAFQSGLKFTPPPNRQDLFSFWGISQEISVLLNCPLHLPTGKKINKKNDWLQLEIATTKCSEFHLALVNGVKVEPSPFWIKDCLELNNFRSVNNLVDISNLVMLETGQPLHIYDSDLLSNKQIIVRQAKEGEKLKSVNGSTIDLVDRDLIVASGEKIISLAGIIGGQIAAVNDKTNNIFIEAASFDNQSVQDTSQRLSIVTQASKSFKKGTNLFGVKEALLRAVKLINESLQSKSVNEIFSFTQKKKKRKKTITISQKFIEKKLGIELSSKEIEGIWKQLKFSFKKLKRGINSDKTK